MAENKAEKYLKNIQERILHYRQQIDLIYSSLCNTEKDFIQDRVQSTFSMDKLLNGLILINEYEQKLEDYIVLGQRYISLLDSEAQRNILIAFYIDNQPVKEIASLFSYSIRHVYRVHDDAISQLSEYI